MKPSNTRRLLVLYLAASLVVSIAISFFRDAPGDRAFYDLGARRYLAGEQFYCPDDNAAFTYPPFFVLAYIPFSRFIEPVAEIGWTFTNLCLGGAVVWLTLRLARPLIERGEGTVGPPRGVAWLVLAAFTARFLLSPIEYQGHDLIVYFLSTLAISAWAAGGDKAAGFWAGLAAACKATPLLFFPCFLRQRRLAASAVLLLTLAAATLLPDLFRRNPDSPVWVSSWYGRFVSKVGVADAPSAQGAWTKWNPLNQSLSGTIYRLGTPGLSQDVCLYTLSASQIRLFTLAAYLAVLAVVFWATSPRHLCGLDPAQRAFSVLGMGGTVFCGMLLLSPMSSKQHFCVLFTPLTFLIIDFLYRRRDPIVAAALAVCFVFGTFGKDILGRELGTLSLCYGSLTLVTLVCLLTSCHVVVSRGRALSAERGAETERRNEPAPPKMAPRPKAAANG
ncbi:MAG: DUF2029 domain-containing protein [Pirellulales bacterium]|nr:DUF2029 domain-containing protein [Pirellulales bacterium]